MTWLRIWKQRGCADMCSHRDIIGSELNSELQATSVLMVDVVGREVRH